MRRTGLFDTAFSLIELLVVMAIIGLLAAFAVPAISNIGRAQGVTDAAYQIASAIELARTEAVARRTYAWLGIQESDVVRAPALWVGVVLSRDGTPNLAPDNLLSITRPNRIDAVGIADVSDPADGINLADFRSGAAFQLGDIDFEGCTLTFTPTGEIFTAAAPGLADGFEPRIVLPLRGAKGETLDAENPIDLLVDGSTGFATLRRTP